MLLQNTSHHILVQLAAEGVRNLLSDFQIAEFGISPFHFKHGGNYPRQGTLRSEHIVHLPVVFLDQLANPPRYFASGFEEVFFSSRRILARLIWRIVGWRRACCVGNATVQRLAPAGAKNMPML